MLLWARVLETLEMQVPGYHHEKMLAYDMMGQCAVAAGERRVARRVERDRDDADFVAGGAPAEAAARGRIVDLRRRAATRARSRAAVKAVSPAAASPVHVAGPRVQVPSRVRATQLLVLPARKLHYAKLDDRTFNNKSAPSPSGHSSWAPSSCTESSVID